MKADTKDALGMLLQNQSIDWNKHYIFHKKWYTYRELLDEIRDETEYGLHIVANIILLKKKLNERQRDN